MSVTSYVHTYRHGTESSLTLSVDAWEMGRVKISRGLGPGERSLPGLCLFFNLIFFVMVLAGAGHSVGAS